MNCITIGHLLFASNGELINCKIVLDILEGQKRAMIGFFNGRRLESTRSSSSNKAAAKAAKAQKKPAASSSKNGKTSTKSNNSSANILEGHKAATVCVFHTTTGARGPNAGRAKPRTVKAKRCGAPKGGGGRWGGGGVSSRGNSGGYRQILSQLVIKTCY